MNLGFPIVLKFKKLNAYIYRQVSPLRASYIRERTTLSRSYSFAKHNGDGHLGIPVGIINVAFVQGHLRSIQAELIF